MSRGENEELLAAHGDVADAMAALSVNAMDAPCEPAADAKQSPEHSVSRLPDFASTAPPELRAQWTEPDSSDVPVRGESYMDDQLKVPAGRSVALLLHFDLWTTKTAEARHHIARFDLQREKSVLRACAQQYPHALVFVLNIELPASDNVSLVSYWLVPNYRLEEDEDEEDVHGDQATFYRLLRRFCEAEDDENTFRDARFKLIPSFTQAPWILNQLVQSRPALTGKKLTQRYFRGANYMEVDLDVSSSTVAHYIGSLCQNWATYIEVDVFITVQGETEDELPEKILGGVRLTYLDLSLAQPIDEDDTTEEE